MSENIDINVGIIKEEISINAANNIVEVNINTAPVSVINPHNYDLSEFTNTSLNPFVRTSGLSSYVPTSRTLTINGTTQDLSADRTFTISTGITIGTTAITSGTVGRVLFEGTGNVVQESANLFWDNTNARLGVGIAVPTSKLHVKFNGALTSGIDIDSTAFNTNHLSFSKDGVMRGQIGMNDSSGEIRYFCGAGGYYPTFWSNNTERMRIQASTGNVCINTASDAGYKLDVNGTARVNNDFTIGSNRYLKAFRWTQDDVTKSLQLESNSNYNVDSVNVISLNNSLLNNTKNLINIGLASTVTTQSSGSTDFFNSVYIQTAYNFTGGTHTVRGIYYNPTLTSLTGTTHRAIETTSGGAYFNTTSVNASAVLQADSTTQGFLPPRMTTTQKNAIATPAAGLMVYDTTLTRPCFYDGTTWITL